MEIYKRNLLIAAVFGIGISLMFFPSRGTSAEKNQKRNWKKANEILKEIDKLKKKILRQRIAAIQNYIE
ncbi:MAG: hypothetical protein AAB564_02480 [Patescibacteria group bacterium]